MLKIQKPRTSNQQAATSNQHQHRRHCHPHPHHHHHHHHHHHRQININTNTNINISITITINVNVNININININITDNRKKEKKQKKKKGSKNNCRSCCKHEGTNGGNNCLSRQKEHRLKAPVVPSMFSEILLYHLHPKNHNSRNKRMDELLRYTDKHISI